ncbi:hypothetical protein [Natrinema versiforme]|uniref:hypothetical protein n=1 Tax=Natrinema versiforme TaxID=88724 RepID=UPI00135F10BB|nr:hypothetical protein [Natrinema versiforme]
MSDNEIDYEVRTREDGIVEIEMIQDSKSVVATTDRDGVEKLIRDLRSARDAIDEHDLD